MSTSLTEIDKITSEFRKDIVQPDGSRVLLDKHLEYQKTIHFNIPHMEYDVLCEMPRYLVRTSIFPNGARYGNIDQVAFWLWMAEVSNFGQWDFKYKDKRFRDLFGLLISSHLVDVSKITMPINYHFTRFIGNFHILPACYSFPFLERCIRFKCYKYVDEDGTVIKQFNIPRNGRSDRSYKIGQRVSNISHELILLYNYVASPYLQNTLYKFLNELNEDSWLRIPDPFNLIGDWRNNLLHGKNIWSSGWEIATYLICLILLSYISNDEYNTKIDSLREFIRYKQKMNSPFLWYINSV